jgi:hypothetical protein
MGNYLETLRLVNMNMEVAFWDFLRRSYLYRHPEQPLAGGIMMEMVYQSGKFY